MSLYLHLFVPQLYGVLIHLRLIVDDMREVYKSHDLLDVFFLIEPGPMDAPVLLNVKARTMSIVWQQPAKSNGALLHYNIYQHGRLYLTASWNVTNWTVVHLHPHTAYQFQVEACTSRGCSMSPLSQTVWTLPETPEGIPSPEVFSNSPTSIIVSWQPPTHPSGLVENFTIERRVKGKEEVMILTTFPRDHPMKFIDDDPALSPWTQYEYRVLGSTPDGGTNSSTWVEVTTKPSRPSGVQPPMVHVLGPDAVKVRCSVFWLLCKPADVKTYPACTLC